MRGGSRALELYVVEGPLQRVEDAHRHGRPPCSPMMMRARREAERVAEHADERDNSDGGEVHSSAIVQRVAALVG